MEEGVILEKVKKAIPHILMLPSPRLWVSYDDVADVLYISFEKPQHATDSEQIDDIILHYREDKIVGITAINAKKTFASL